MTVHQLPTASVRLTDAVSGARDLVGSAAATALTHVDDDALARAVEELAALESQAAALRLSVAAEADVRRLADALADTGTDSWMAKLTGETREAANGGIWLARLMREKYHATRDAFAAGKLRFAQVRVIVAAAEKIPARATREQVAAAEAWLVDQATGEGRRCGRPMSATRLRQRARRMCALVDRDLADEHEQSMLNRESRDAELETWFRINDNGNGTFSGRFTLPELHGLLLKRHLEMLSSPRRLSRDRAGKLVTDNTLPGNGPGLNYTEALGVAFCEVLENLPTDGRTARNGVTMIVTMGLADLLSGLGSAARTETGVAISAAEARRLACNSGLVPAVLGGESQPLDLGREQRLFSSAQRQALSLIHDSCAIEGCDRPFAWTEIHHLEPWAKGGRTDLDRALPICFFHHRRAHDDQFDLRRTATGEWRFHRRT